MKKLSMLLLLVAAPLSAEQFNLSMPIKLDHILPTVKNVLVECRVFKAKPPDWMGMTGLVASWNTYLPLDATGSLNQVVLAKFNPDPGANPQDGKYYQCDFRLQVGSYYLWPDPASTQDVVRPKPGTPFLGKQEGWFPGMQP